LSDSFFGRTDRIGNVRNITPLDRDLCVRQGFVGRDRACRDCHHGRYAGPDDVLVPPSGRVITARQEAHPLGRTGVEGFDGHRLRTRRRGAGGDDGDVELRFGQAGGRHLFFELGTRNLFNLH
jgi:hypothetical protein